MQDQIRGLVEDLKTRWKTLQSAKSGWLVNNSRFSLAVPFFLKALDELMSLANKFDVIGLVKKTSVMEAVNELYNLLIDPSIPIYLAPFKGKIKGLVVDVVISHLIDFLVAKVRSVINVAP